jgi:hypothetical protein
LVNGGLLVLVFCVIATINLLKIGHDPRRPLICGVYNGNKYAVKKGLNEGNLTEDI